jgi:hypothetical protein
MYKFSGHLTELVLEIITVLFRAAKVFHTLQDQWTDMRVHVFAGASPEKQAQKRLKSFYFLVSSKYQIYIVFSCLEMQIYLVLHANSG